MLALIAPALSLAAPAAAGDGAIRLAADTEARWVPFEITATNQLRFAMTLNGKAAQAILDTGVSHSFVTRTFAAKAGLTAERPQQATAIGGTVAIGWAPVGTLAVGGLARSGGRIGVTDAPDQGRFGADLFLGSDILGCCALDIDYDARRFRILPSGRLAFAGAQVPLRRARASGVPLATARLGGAAIRPLIVDTGDGGGITLTAGAWAATGIRDVPTTSTIGWGLGGESVADLAVLPGIRLGDATPVEAEVRIEPDSGYSGQVGVAGRIGNALLMRFRVLLDPRAGRMVLAPGDRLRAPTPRSTSGLLLGYGKGALRVLHVMRHSPAAATGWRIGERICAVDGSAVARAAGEPVPIGWASGAPGTTVRLTLCDGTERMLTLRRFY